MLVPLSPRWPIGRESLRLGGLCGAGGWVVQCWCFPRGSDHSWVLCGEKETLSVLKGLTLLPALIQHPAEGLGVHWAAPAMTHHQQSIRTWVERSRIHRLVTPPLALFSCTPSCPPAGTFWGHQKVLWGRGVPQSYTIFLVHSSHQGTFQQCRILPAFYKPQLHLDLKKSTHSLAVSSQDYLPLDLQCGDANGSL